MHGRETHIGRTHDATDLFHRVQIGAETAMHGEDLLVDDCSDGQAVEAISECLPELNVVPPLALVIEAIDTVDGGTFVVTTENKEVFRIFDLVRKEEADGLKRLLATVDVVSEEEVIGFRREATVFEKTQEIVVLAVNVTTDLDWRFQFQQYRLRDENLPSLGAKIPNLRFQQLHLLSRPAAPHLQQSINDVVQIHFLISHDVLILETKTKEKKGINTKASNNEG